MAYRTILACVDAGRNRQSVLSVAHDLAREHDAKLVGLHVTPPTPHHGALRLPRDIAESFARQRKEAMREVERQFKHTARDLPRHAWETIEVGEAGQVETAICRRARCADLAVVGQVGGDEEVAEHPGTLPEQLVLEAGRPILVVPPALSNSTVGRRIMIAWNQSREASRALADALPLLRRAEQVWVLTIDERGARNFGARMNGDTRAEQAVAHLAEHGIQAKALRDATGQINAGDILLSRLSDLTADLLVLGAYGHSRWRELVLGGVTRDLLSHMTVPVLMAH